MPVVEPYAELFLADVSLNHLTIQHFYNMTDWPTIIFQTTADNFEEHAMAVFRHQFFNNPLYKEYCNLFNRTPENTTNIEAIPFLPIGFFKTHAIKTGEFQPEIIFESSGTTGTINSRHLIADIPLYKESFRKTFLQQYGSLEGICIAGLLPSYLEKGNSSLVYMVHDLIEQSHDEDSGFFLHDDENLIRIIKAKELNHQKTILFGVTYALLDLAEKYPMSLKNTIVIETGGMKGRREEMTRAAVHTILKNRWGLNSIHSEYGMTELLSQAYSNAAGIYSPAPWMKILLRQEDDPLKVESAGLISKPGLINIIDLANIHSCAFIATDDVGILNPDGSFLVQGRLDNSDLRGCSLLTVN